MPTDLATHGGAAGAGRPLIAGGIADIAEIGAAGALQEVAAHGRLVANLRARRVQQSFGDDGKLLDHERVRSHIRHGGGSAEPEALWSDIDALVEEAAEADESIGSAHMFLQELHHIGSAGDVLGRRGGAPGLGLECERGGKVVWTFEREGMHGSASSYRTCDAGRIPNRGDDMVVGAAAAQIAAHPVADLLRRVGMALGDAGDAGHDLPRRAIAALEGVPFDECCLQRVELLALHQAFDRRDLATFRERRE